MIIGKKEKTEKQYAPMGGLFRHHLETFRQEAESGKDPKELIYDILGLSSSFEKNDWVFELVEMVGNDFSEKTYEIPNLQELKNRIETKMNEKEPVVR